MTDVNVLKTKFTFGGGGANFSPAPFGSTLGASASAADKGPVPFKLIIVGDGGIGKTSFAKRVSSGEPIDDIANAKYVPTVGVAVTSPVDFETNKGKMTFSFWDTAGQEKLGGLRDGYFIGANAAILCYDVTKPASFKSITTQWFRDVTRVCPTIPIAFVGLRLHECEEGAGVHPQQVADFVQRKGGACKAFTVSTKDGLGLDAPFAFLLQQITRKDDLAITVAEKKTETAEAEEKKDDGKKEETEAEKKEEGESRIDLSPLEAALEEAKEEAAPEKKE